jgi:hypothetical protein
MNINLAKEKIPFYKLKIFVFCFSITAVTTDREILIELFMSHLKTANKITILKKKRVSLQMKKIRGDEHVTIIHRH